MKNVKKFIKNHLSISIIIGLVFLTSLFAFKPAEQVKQIMTIEVIETGRSGGVYVYAGGVNIEIVEIPDLKTNREIVLENGTILNATLTKYYNEGWRLVGSSKGSFTMNVVYTGTRIYLEK